MYRYNYFEPRYYFELRKPNNVIGWLISQDTEAGQRSSLLICKFILLCLPNFESLAGV
jgi:hypothetical protein